jgi:hypothetical protein
VVEQRSSICPNNSPVSLILRQFGAILEYMVEVLRTNDVVLLSFVSALLDDADIDALVFDTHASIMEGSLGVLPRRIMVADGDEYYARKVIDQAMDDVGVKD